ncbi:MAG: hypothetical protein F2667_14775 [Actinobacteria bacterium]|uniref:Unannotated protein n=1 Tax=freshwater metagenome TaxID=449393 RepID=A0A6J6SJP2_9ZZZZ|nr:hypothetical protein [Actinomycetota bacterium]
MSSNRLLGVALGLALTATSLLAPGVSQASPATSSASPTAPSAGGGHARAERALARVDSLLGVRSTRARMTAAPARGRDATLALRRLATLRSELTGADRARADAYFKRPSANKVECTTVCVHWTTSGSDKVNPRDNDGNGLPDYVDSVLDITEHVRDSFATAGYRTPLADGSKGGSALLDVYLLNLGGQGVYGYCTTDGRARRAVAPAYCAFDNDFSSREFPTNSPIENLQVTAAHEYFHAVQFAYDYNEDPWFLEATAAWVEDELYPDVDDNVQYLRSSQLEKPGASMDRFGGSWHYGQWIFFRFLSEQFPDVTGELPSIVREAWELADANPGEPDEYSIDAISDAVAARGTTLTDVFAAYAAGNRHPGTTYEEGAALRYPTAPVAQVAVLSPSKPTRSFDVSLKHLASGTLQTYPTSAMTGGWEVTIDLDMPALARGSAAVINVSPVADGPAEQFKVQLDSAGDASVTLPYDFDAVDYIDVTLSNVGISYACNKGTAFSCGGKSKDDGLTSSVTFTASRG